MAQALDERLKRIVRSGLDLTSVSLAIRDPSDARLVAGCPCPMVWNLLVGRPRGFGIKDCDVACFDAGDRFWDAEDRMIVKVRNRLFPDLVTRVEVRNQVRVTSQYEAHFDTLYVP